MKPDDDTAAADSASLDRPHPLWVAPRVERLSTSFAEGAVGIGPDGEVHS